MFADLNKLAFPYHVEYRRRNIDVPEPLGQSRDGWKRVVGNGLIHLGERLAKAEPIVISVDEAA